MILSIRNLHYNTKKQHLIKAKNGIGLLYNRLMKRTKNVQKNVIFLPKFFLVEKKYVYLWPEKYVME